MFHMPMSSPMMTTMLGFLSCAKTLLTEKVAINAIATVSRDLNGDLAGFIESQVCRYPLGAILDLSLIVPKHFGGCAIRSRGRQSSLMSGIPAIHDEHLSRGKGGRIR